MEGMDVQWDCIVEGDVTMVKYKRAEAKVVTEHFQSGEFEGKYSEVPMASIPTRGAHGSSKDRSGGKESSDRAPRFLEEMEDGDIVTGSIATLSVVIDALPEPDVTWFKDNKRIRNTGRIHSICCIVARESVCIKTWARPWPNWYSSTDQCLQAGHRGSILSWASMRLGCQDPANRRWFIKFPHH